MSVFVQRVELRARALLARPADPLLRPLFPLSTDTRDIVDPLIAAVEKEGITMVEKVL